MRKHPLQKNVLQRIWTIIGLVILLHAVGIVGYMVIEGWDLLDALYMTVTTLTTVGFGEIHPLTGPGKVFTILLISGGVGAWAYAIGAVLRLIVEGQIRIFFNVRRMQKMIGALEAHYIICGFGRMGRLVCRQLADEKIPFVVVENRPSPIEELKKLDYLHITGDATQEECLLSAGIKSAKALISVLGTDAGNVYAVLTARHINPHLHIVCRSEDEEAEDKILKAGANRVISPYRIGGKSLANAAMRPHVLDFIDLVTTKTELALTIEEVPIPAGSPLAGKSLVESRIRERFGVMIMACRNKKDEMIFNPPATHILNEGDMIVALGEPARLKEMDDRLFQGSTKTGE